MALFKKAISEVFSNLSKPFKYVLCAGFVIFALQLIAIATCYIVYMTSDTFIPEIKYYAEKLTTNSLSFITFVIIGSVTGDFIVFGR